MTRTLPSAEYLKECFEYNPDTGTLSWRERPLHHFKSVANQATWNKTWAGKITASKTGSHLQVMISAQNFLIHRIVWKIYTGNDPPQYIDHINMNGHDNRWENLREATHSQNHANARMRRNNKVGLKGVCIGRWGKGYKADIGINQKTVGLGTYKTKEEAHAAYCKAAQEFFGEFWRSE
jgi:HNH endonuclease